MSKDVLTVTGNSVSDWRPDSEDPMSASTVCPLVSIILPVHNDATTVALCISSLLGQDYSKKELIVVDDGSTDGSDLIVQGFDVRYARTAHRGRSHARNLGLAISVGSLIVFGEADAFYSKDFVSTCLHNFQDPRIGAVNVRQHVSNRTCLLTCSKEAMLSARQSDRSDFKAIHANTAIIFRREALEALSGFDENLDCAEDIDIGYRLTRIGYEVAIEDGTRWWHREPDSVLEAVKRRFWSGRTIWPFLLKHRKIPPHVLVLSLIAFAMALSWRFLVQVAQYLFALFLVLLIIAIRLYTLRLHKSKRPSMVILWCMVDLFILFPAETLGLILGFFDIVRGRS